MALNDGGNAFQGLLNPGSSMDSYFNKLNAYEAATKGLSPGLKEMGFLGIPGLFNTEKEPWEETQKKLKWYLGEQENAAVKKAEMNKKANQEAVLLQSVAGLGKNIAAGLGGPSWDTIERNRQSGLTAINNMRPPTIQPLEIAQFQSRPYYS